MSNTQHDETFYITKGTVRFHAKDGGRIDATVGDVIVVPTNAPHTFENISGEEAAFFNVSGQDSLAGRDDLLEECLTLHRSSRRHITSSISS